MPSLNLRTLPGGLLACLISAAALAEPTGYVIPSDGIDDATADSLHRVNLATGDTTLVGALGGPFEDVEALALSENGELFGVDDATETLLFINRDTGVATPVNGTSGNLLLGRGIDLDPGLTWSCDGQLLMSSDVRETLYSLNPETGEATVIGGEGALGAPISGLAVLGNRVYGLGSEGSASLYQINVETGTSTLVGPLGGDLDFPDGGIAFDEAGGLWGVADQRSVGNDPAPSRIFRINTETGQSTPVAETIIGVENLAITSPQCGTARSASSHRDAGQSAARSAGAAACNGFHCPAPARCLAPPPLTRSLRSRPLPQGEVRWGVTPL